MTAGWLVACALACACAYASSGAERDGARRVGARRGGSLRGALEALQRRQRDNALAPDFDMYDLGLSPYAGIYYGESMEDYIEEPAPKYVVRILQQQPKPHGAYEYKMVKKNNNSPSQIITPKMLNPETARTESAFWRNPETARTESAFRERSHHSENDRLRNLFVDKNKNDVDDTKNVLDQEWSGNDEEYALLIGNLWSKYKNSKAQHNAEGASQGAVKLYKNKIVSKRLPDNWGPIAFKKKRSPDSKTEHPVLSDFEIPSKDLPELMDASSYNSYNIADDDKNDLREEYAIAFQPLDDDSLSDLADDDQYAYDIIEKRFPVSKRSSGPYDWSKQKKRFTQDLINRETSEKFRSSSGTDPKIIKDLSKIFGDSEIDLIKSPVKRSTNQQDNNHDGKPPQLAMMHQNHTNVHNNASSMHDEESHEHRHNLHHPGISGKEVEHVHDHDHSNSEKPLVIKKKSIDWSTYFGIDKRKKKSVSFTNDQNEDRLRKQYFDTFNKEVVYPLNSFRKHSNVKRNYVQRPENEENEFEIGSARAIAVRDGDKRNTAQDQDSKFDNIDKKLKNMEGLIVDEALHFSNVGEELDSKEEQEMKEKLLSRLAAAYSLEKMRKALKDFKQSLQTQKPDTTMQPSLLPLDDAKEKRVAIKKEKVEISNNEIPIYNNKDDDFEDEQGAGHYLNGKMEHQFSEGYMGGSGRHRTPSIATEGATGACPVLAKIVQRCRGVDLLAGDRGQLFLPLCSLHQICYLCGEAPPTTCDLVFLSEADTSCEGDTGCQRAARATLMALRELHDGLVDELDGECEANPCLPATLTLNAGWQLTLQR